MDDASKVLGVKGVDMGAKCAFLFIGHVSTIMGSGVVEASDFFGRLAFDLRGDVALRQRFEFLGLQSAKGLLKELTKAVGSLGDVVIRAVVLFAIIPHQSYVFSKFVSVRVGAVV